MESETLEVTTDAFTALNFGSRRNEVLAELEKRRNVIAATDVNDKANSNMIWMQKVRDLVQGLYFPDQIFWSDDEDSAPEDQFTYIVLQRLRECSQRYVCYSAKGMLTMMLYT